MQTVTYRRYFDIDPDFFPAVNNDVIKKNPELWKKYFPHETFINLLKQTVNALERNQKLNIWVEGAYGTGKSHAVLTLKHLLDASEQEVKEYFEAFKLDQDLCQKFIAAKSHGRIITVHRYGSSSIHNDNDLFLAMQESIDQALNEAGISNAGPNAIRNGIIKYLSNEENKRSFDVYVSGSYRELFGGESVDDIVNHLGEYQDQALQALMDKIFKVANEKQLKAFSLDDTMMVNWISEVIKANNLKAIVFIWDEFTEYFSNNAHRLTGFQRILDMSQTEPFCFIPVTHKRDAGMDDADSDKKKILDRFLRPSCIIELPDNMAFQLMGAAMRRKNDDEVLKEWDGILLELEERTHDSRGYIKDKAEIKEHELRGVLPIHPYAACMLKYLSASFASNQRSMFDFIKNAGNEELRGFQYYIDHYGPFDENPFLTIDLLWGFFYENGRNDLSISIRQILDRYSSLSKHLNSDEQSVLKTVLLLQAISQSTGDRVEMFFPNEKNIRYAFEGTQLDTVAINCAEKLVKEKVLYKRTLIDGTVLFSVLIGDMDANQIEKEKAKFKEKSTSNLIADAKIEEAVELDHDLKSRFIMSFVGSTDFDQKTKLAIDKSSSDIRHFQVIVGVSKNAAESVTITKKIQKYIAQNNDLIFIDCGKSPLTDELFDKWVENMAISSYNTGKDHQTATQYNNYANQILSKWGANIRQGQFVLYSQSHPSGENIQSLEALNVELRNIDRKRFELSLECHFRSISPWWVSSNLPLGAECGITRILKGTYTNTGASLKTQLSNSWETSNYWELHPSEPISRIKIKLNELIERRLKDDGRISIQEIYSFLTNPPFGFLPCNLSAFFMGYLLKEYVDDKYSWSDNNTSDNMSLDRMKGMIDEIIKNDKVPDSRYHDKYIVAMTPEEKAFAQGTATAFEIPKSNCSTVESARNQVRGKMKEYSFPTWTLKYVLSYQSLQCPVEVIDSLITLYQELVNNQSGKSESEVANEIGKTFLAYENASSDLKSIFTEEICRQGMLAYLEKYRDGELPNIANQLGDHGQFINELRSKINASEANWLWKQETVDKQIDTVILEYRIAEETSNLLESCSSYKSSISAWISKVGNLKVSYEAVKEEVPNIQPLLLVLKEMTQQGDLPESKKEQFLDLLKGYGGQFKLFYTNQIEYFKKTCNISLQGLSDGDKEKIFLKISSGQFTADKASYHKLVEDTVLAYRKELGSLKLKTLWKDKTHTDSPIKWSETHKMPILALIPEDEESECREMFDILNHGNPSDKDIEKAINYLEKFKYWDILNDKDAQDKAFISRILGDRSVILTDVQKVKEYLSSHVSEIPYHWMGNSQVSTTLKSYAEHEYEQSGFSIAMDKIDSMNADDVKKYLKELIKNNMTVGIQIIKNN